MNHNLVVNGIDNLESYDGLFRGRRLGLVTGPTGVNRNLQSTVDVLRARYQLMALYGPEHGIWGDAQAGEAVASAAVDRRTGLPVHSLYGDNRRLNEEMVRGVDMLVFDMQDVGTRYFTYLYTLAYVMQGCAAFGLPLVVLDRVNPLNGATVGGNVLDEKFSSFVGKYAIPARYGLTVGEFARYINAEKGIGCDLTVVPCAGWRREMYYDDTGLPWVMPSPNLPTLDSALCYPGTCLFEGTNLSEGRGTTKPFELIGAPWIDPVAFARGLTAMELPGVLFRPASFRPTFSKHAGETCHGVQVHVVDRARFDPFLTGLRMVRVVMEHGEFAFIRTGERYFIDLLLGSDALRRPGFDEAAFLGDSEKSVGEFLRVRAKYFLY